MSEEWKRTERELADMTVDTVNALRNTRGFTIKDLAERLGDYGWPVSVATLTGILSGRKRGSFSIAETMAFARALNVSPTYLILGLPSHESMPASDLFGSEHDIGSIAAWFAGEHTMQPHPDDDISAENKSREYFAEALARQGLHDVLRHTHMLRVIRWQAAQLVAASKFRPEEISRILPSAVLDQTFLWDAINMLSSTRQGQARLDGIWSIQLPPIPEWLRFIEIDPPVEVEDPTIETLRTLTSEQLIEEATQRFRAAIAEAPTIETGRQGLGDNG